MRTIIDIEEQERSDSHFDRALRMARADFTEMPGLRLTFDQARRLWALDDTVCDAVLRTLVEVRFLRRGNTPDPSYMRV